MQPKSQNVSVTELQKQLTEFNVTAYDQAILAPTPKLSKITEVHGHDIALGLVAAVLTEISTLLSFPVTSAMIEAAADIIAQRWNDVKVSDLILFKSKVISGEIGGQLYRLDARTFTMLFDEYYTKRLDVVEGLLERKNTVPLRGKDEGLMTMEQILKSKPVEKTPDQLKAEKEAMYGKLKQNAEEKHDREKWQAKSKNMDLETMCKVLEVSHDEVKRIALEDCKEAWDESCAMPFDVHFKNHMQRLQNEGRKDSAVLLAYKS